MPCSHGNRTPRELYEKALECWQDKCITVFGRTSEEILLALTCYDDCLMMKKQEQKPMTREEAQIIADKFCYKFLIDALEQLGLLKFDEAPKKQVEWVNGIGSRCWFSEGYDPNKSEWTRVDSEWTRVESVTPESIVEFNFKASGVDNPKLRTMEVINNLLRCGYKIVRNSS